MDLDVAPAESLDDVVARLNQVVEYARGQQSRLAYFACLYREVTLRVRDAVAEGRFEDAARMERLDVAFANRYLAALGRHLQGQAPTRSWASAFSAARRWNLLILQHILVAINAHINLDLGVAAVEAAPGEALPGLANDFKEITVLLGEMLEDVQDRLTRVSPWMGLLDYLGCRTDEAIFTFGLRTSRDLAWRTAVYLWQVDPLARPGEIELLDRRVAILA